MVLDPFCGRGTSNYAARALKLSSYGIDTSPIAVAIAQAKLAVAEREDVLDLLDEILEDVEPAQVPRGEFWRRAFHPYTLYQLCQLREGLATRRSGTARRRNCA